MHMTLLVVGYEGESLTDLMEPFCQDLEVEEYCVGPVEEYEKERCLKYYNEGGKQYETFDDCYAEHKQDWNGGAYRKNDLGVWEEFSKSNPRMEWDWWEVGGRWPGRLTLKEGAKPLQLVNFSWGWKLEEKDAFLKENPHSADIAYKRDVANLKTLTSYSILIDGEWEEIDGPVYNYLKDVPDHAILYCVDYHM